MKERLSSESGVSELLEDYADGDTCAIGRTTVATHVESSPSTTSSEEETIMHLVNAEQEDGDQQAKMPATNRRKRSSSSDTVSIRIQNKNGSVVIVRDSFGKQRVPQIVDLTIDVPRDKLRKTKSSRSLTLKRHMKNTFESLMRLPTRDDEVDSNVTTIRDRVKVVDGNGLTYDLDLDLEVQVEHERRQGRSAAAAASASAIGLWRRLSRSKSSLLRRSQTALVEPLVRKSATLRSSMRRRRPRPDATTSCVDLSSMPTMNPMTAEAASKPHMRSTIDLFRFTTV